MHPTPTRRVAPSPARSPARSPTRSPARSAARSATRSAARSATRSAARSAAFSEHARSSLAVLWNVQRLGEKLVEAIIRDFPESERALGSVSMLTAAQIAHVGQIHLRGCALYQQELQNALAVANREGEDARREERMRIWGYA